MDYDKNDTFVRILVSFNPVELDVWRRRLIQIFFDIKDQIQSGNFTKNWSACDGRFNYPCIYTPLCEGWNSNLIQLKKQQLYEKKEEWRPW